jgi:hypothetical protein
MAACGMQWKANTLPQKTKALIKTEENLLYMSSPL